MKHIFLWMMLLLGSCAMASAQTIRNSNNAAIATIESDGTVRSSNHLRLATSRATASSATATALK